MANLKELRNRINSVSSTMQITSAMKMVSAAKLSKAQDAITKMRPYADKLTQLLQDLSVSVETGDSGNKLTEERELKNVLIVAITSNKGLAGAFNANIIKKVRELAVGEYKEQNIALLTIGKKGNEVLNSKKYIIDHNDDSLVADLKYADVAKLTDKIIADFVAETYDKVVIIYNHFKNAGTQIVQVEQMLPLVPPPKEEQKEINTDYIFEPVKEDILAELMPKALKMQLYKALRDSIASEHGARMTAMHKATDNATELRNDLKLSYNKARQAAITNEILEIVAGAEALNS